MIGNDGRDWLSGQIDLLARGLAAMFGQLFAPEIEEEQKGSPVISEGSLLAYMIQKYLHDGKINEAENLLFESLDTSATAAKLQLALNFYQELDKMNDEELENSNFSRQEIYDGLTGVKEFFS